MTLLPNYGSASASKDALAAAAAISTPKGAKRARKSRQNVISSLSLRDPGIRKNARGDLRQKGTLRVTRNRCQRHRLANGDRKVTKDEGFRRNPQRDFVAKRHKGDAEGIDETSLLSPPRQPTKPNNSVILITQKCQRSSVT